MALLCLIMPHPDWNSEGRLGYWPVLHPGAACPVLDGDVVNQLQPWSRTRQSFTSMTINQQEGQRMVVMTGNDLDSP
jgi:hypothetical protein